MPPEDEKLVDEFAAVEAERQCALHIGFLGQQHAFDVGVLDDRDRLAGRVLVADGPSLGADPGVLE